MTIVDTSVWIDYLAARENPETLWLKRQISHERIGLTDLILCEVLQGLRNDRAAERVQKQLEAMRIFEAGGVQVAIAAAANYRGLRESGITVRKTIDCLIASFCILEGHALLHRDRDYDPFERQLGLRVIHP